MSTHGTGTSSHPGTQLVPCTPHALTASLGGQGGAAPYPACSTGTPATAHTRAGGRGLGSSSSSSSSGHSFLSCTPMLPTALVGSITEKWVPKSCVHPYSVTQWPQQPGPGQPVCVRAQQSLAASSCAWLPAAVPGCLSLRARVWRGPRRGHAALLRVKRADDSAKEHQPPHLFWGHQGCQRREPCLQRQARPCSCHRDLCCSGYRDTGSSAGSCGEEQQDRACRIFGKGREKPCQLASSSSLPSPTR